ncbi:MAG TPA: hypothetical protein VGL58_02310 [Caulobacteraceae bacterium]
MSDYEVYVDDDRYQVPSLYLISANSEARARAIVDELWRGSEHHHGVEVRRDGERLWGLGSLAEGAPMTRRSAPQSRGSAL